MASQVISSSTAPRRYCAVILVAIGACILGSGCGKNITEQSDLKVPDQSHQFGLVRPNSLNVYQFQIVNPFGEMYRVDHIWTSCGCTGLSPRDRNVESGDAIVVDMTYHAPNALGNYGAQAIIYGRVGQRPVELTYAAHATVADILKLPVAENVDYIDLGHRDMNAAVHTTTKLLNYGGYPLTFDEVRAHTSIPGVVIKPFVLSEGVSLQCDISNDDIVGSIGMPVTFEFWNHGRRLKDIQTIQAYIVFTGPVIATPRSIILRNYGKVESQAEVEIRASDGIASDMFEIISARATIPAIKLKFDNKDHPRIVSVSCSAGASVNSIDSGDIELSVKLNGKVFKAIIGVTALN